MDDDKKIYNYKIQFYSQVYCELDTQILKYLFKYADGNIIAAPDTGLNPEDFDHVEWENGMYDNFPFVDILSPDKIMTIVEYEHNVYRGRTGRSLCFNITEVHTLTEEEKEFLLDVIKAIKPNPGGVKCKVDAEFKYITA